MSKKKLRLYVGQEVEITDGEHKGKRAWVARYQWWPESVCVALNQREVEYAASCHSVDTEAVRPIKEMLRALSLQQPWAWLMTRPDLTDPELRAAALASEELKPLENRKWRTRFRGPVLVHASLRFDYAGYAWVREHFPSIPLPLPSDYQFGGIVGRFDITDCVSWSPSRWFFGPYAFPVINAVPLPFTPCKGALSFFTPTLTAEQWAALLD